MTVAGNKHNCKKLNANTSRRIIILCFKRISGSFRTYSLCFINLVCESERACFNWLNPTGPQEGRGVVFPTTQDGGGGLN